MNNAGKTYFENLDTLRFFAFLSVFFSHCLGIFNYTFSNKYFELIHKHYFYNGDLGVSFFFTLSGFLITWLLLFEQEKNKKIKLGFFYMRRILRIWPVYFLVVAIGFIISIYINSPLLDQNHILYKINLNQLKWYLFFLANYDLIINGISSVFLNVLWSVSVEEQFYLIWPLFFVFLEKKRLPLVCISIIVASFIFKCFSYQFSNFSTFEVMSDLAIGGLVAYYCFFSISFTEWVRKLSKKKIILIYLLLFVFIPARGFSHYFGEKIYSIYYSCEGIILSGFFVFIIMEQIYSLNSFIKFGKIMIFTKLGRISYGLYAYHMLSFPFALLIADKLNLPTNNLPGYLLKVTCAFLFTVIISTLSFNYYEKKILSFKKYFQPVFNN